jgi:uncharacterized protein YpmS
MVNKISKPRRPQSRKFLLAASVVLLAGLACNLGAGPRPPAQATPIPVTTESVEELQENLQVAATQASTSGEVTLVIDEAQLTSLVAFELQDQEEQFFQDPQVYLRDGQIQLYGSVVQGGISLPVSIIATLSVDEGGMPRYKIVSATAGPVPLPQSILDQLTARLDQVIASQLNPERTDMVVENILIDDGKMTITGHKQ